MAYYLRSTINLKFGALPAYSEMMRRLLPHMSRVGWKLVIALQPMVGALTEITHVWEVERLSDIEAGLAACANDPHLREVLSTVPDLLISELTQIGTKTTYST